MKVEKRGRPKTLNLEEKPRKFIREFNNFDGTKDVWKYNLDIHPYGPISAEANVKF